MKAALRATAFPLGFSPSSLMVGVAQLVRAPDCGSGGRRFNSGRPPFHRGLGVLTPPELPFILLSFAASRRK